METIPVFYDQFEVGRFTLTEGGPAFRYDPRWLRTAQAFPISLSVPLQDRLYGPDILEPWLRNLLPEASALAVAGRKLGIAKDDAIGMLLRIGQDTAGALSFEKPQPTLPPSIRPILAEAELERIIEELPAKPFLVGEEGVSMSLAGVQEKLPVFVQADGALAIPINGMPSTHILKPNDEKRLFGNVQNEALCMVLAAQCGLPTAAVTTGKAGLRSYLLVTRYDRVLRGTRPPLRIHQEDFCQALGKPPSAKYERNQTGIKGPMLKDMIGLVSASMTALETNRMLDAVIFNVLICNTDSHAKNYSILLTGERTTLAPLYDLNCADCWDVTRNMSQTISGKDRGDHLHGRHWKRFAEECKLRPSLILPRVERMAGKLLRALPAARTAVEAMPAGGHVMLDQFCTAIERRTRTILRQLAE